jgi:hypothetical protein
MRYPAGDVRRYGVFPDGVDVTALVFNGTITVTCPASTLNASMVGMTVCSPLAKNVLTGNPVTIISVLPDGSGCTLSAAAAGSGTGNARIGTYWENSYGERISALIANSRLPGVEVFWPAGNYVTGINVIGAASSGIKMNFQEGAEFSGILHFLADAGYPGTGAALSNIRLRGSLTTYDRLGMTGIVNGDLSQLNVLCKSDPTKHTFGNPGRGVHIYSGLANTRFGNFVIEDCPSLGVTTNTDAAFALDSSDTVDCTFGRVWVRDSAGHGAVILGSGHTFAEVRVDAWGYGAHDRQMAETVSLAQCQELCGVWMIRCPGLRIGTLRVAQGSGTRTNALYEVRATDTETATVLPKAISGIQVDAMYAPNINRRGISIGDRNHNLARNSACSIEALDISYASTLDAGYACVHVNANTSAISAAKNSLTIGSLFVDGNGALLTPVVQVPLKTHADIGLINT